MNDNLKWCTVTLLDWLVEDTLVYWYLQYELPQSHRVDKQEETLFSWLDVYYAHAVFMKLEQSVCCGSLMAIYIMLLLWLVEHSLVRWYQQCVTVHYVPKCMNCHKAIVVITRREKCVHYHDYIYITPNMLLWDLSTPCVVDLLSQLIYKIIKYIYFLSNEVTDKQYIYNIYWQNKKKGEFLDK